ncbi:MAG: NADH dehydrogenase subunit 5 [Candelaria pacifica]|nr:MAG: NADH dehydrogenase subunit 5 [Candelaria pacifica]
MSKSAQVPLHTWLPDAMEGPTPVSALIHAATLVTAGVYLMLRSSPLLEYGPTALVVITWVGALTAFFAATTGLVQSDLKRVIAYSTCSQLGYMFIAVGLSQYNVALLHLVGHAFFKALLFLAAGAVIHGMADQQDLRRLGGLVGFMPLTYTAILVGSLSLMALPWLTGFYSKDLVLELASGRYVASGTLAYWLGTLAAGCTAFYSFRLVSLAFFGVPNAPRGDYLHAHDAPMLIVVPLVLLSTLAIGFGYVAKDLWVGPGTDFLSTALFQHPSHVALVEAEFALPLGLKLLPAIVSIGGASLAVYIYHVIPGFSVNVSRSGVGLFLYRFLVGKWLFDVVVVGLVIKPALALGHVISKVLDRGVIELVGPFGLTTGLTSTARLIARYDSGLVTSYALYMVLGILVLILYAFAPIVLGNFDAGEDYGLLLVFLTSLMLLPRTITTNSPHSRKIKNKFL